MATSNLRASWQSVRIEDTSEVGKINIRFAEFMVGRETDIKGILSDTLDLQTELGFFVVLTTPRGVSILSSTLIDSLLINIDLMWAITGIEIIPIVVRTNAP